MILSHAEHCGCFIDVTFKHLRLKVKRYVLHLYIKVTGKSFTVNSVP